MTTTKSSSSTTSMTRSKICRGKSIFKILQSTILAKKQTRLEIESEREKKSNKNYAALLKPKIKKVGNFRRKAKEWPFKINSYKGR